MNLSLANTTLSFSDLFSIIGLTQCVAVIVYILFRAGHWRHVIVPVLCFGFLLVSFALDFASTRFVSNFYAHIIVRDAIWMMIPALSVLLIMQIADLGVLPRALFWINIPVLLFGLLLGWGGGAFLGDQDCSVAAVCNVGERSQFMGIVGALLGTLSLMSVWLGRDTLNLLRQEREAKGDRYWLIVSLIVINLALISLGLFHVSRAINGISFLLVRDILGCGMVYLASTSLFRIYPPSVRLDKKEPAIEVSNEDKGLADKLQSLFDLEKIYQEGNFSRTALARELGVSETRVSRIVSLAYGKSLPQIINERRVQDSLQLLAQTDAQISVVAEEVGFNSVPTFNRVFKDIVGQSPSEYRNFRKISG